MTEAVLGTAFFCIIQRTCFDGGVLVTFQNETTTVSAKFVEREINNLVCPFHKKC